MSQILSHLGHSSASAPCLGRLHCIASRKGPRAWSLPRVMLPMPWGLSPLQGAVLSFLLFSPGQPRAGLSTFPSPQHLLQLAPGDSQPKAGIIWSRSLLITAPVPATLCF